MNKGRPAKMKKSATGRGFETSQLHMSKTREIMRKVPKKPKTKLAKPNYQEQKIINLVPMVSTWFQFGPLWF